MQFNLIIFAVVFLFSLFSEEVEFTCRSHIVTDYPVFRYPYTDLEQQLRKRGEKSTKIFSYGSLMAAESAERTFSKETMRTRKPAIAFGIKRVFNRDVPILPESRWGEPNHPEARGMLNVIYADEDTDFVNGVVFDVQVADLVEMAKREVGYDLIPVKCMNWEKILKVDHKEDYIAYTFHARTETEYTDENIFPRPGYYELSRDASKQYGTLFYLLWLKTTFLSDGVTSITEWEDKICQDKPKTQIK